MVAHLLEEGEDLFGLVGVALELDAAVDVLGVLAEDDHVDLVGPLVGGLDALEVADGADAGVQVEPHAQVDVDAAEAAADGRGERALEAQGVMLEGLEGVVGQIQLALLLLAEGGDLLVLDLGIVQLAGHVAGVDVEPDDAALALVGLVDGGIEDAHGTGGDAGRAADVAANAVAADEADNGIVRDVPAAMAVNGNASTLGRRSELLVSLRRHESSIP